MLMLGASGRDSESRFLPQQQDQIRSRYESRFSMKDVQNRAKSCRASGCETFVWASGPDRRHHFLKTSRDRLMQHSLWRQGTISSSFWAQSN